MRIDVRNHEIMLAILLGIDDIIDEALQDAVDGKLTAKDVVDYLHRMKFVTRTINVIAEHQEDT